MDFLVFLCFLDTFLFFLIVIYCVKRVMYLYVIEKQKKKKSKSV